MRTNAVIAAALFAACATAGAAPREPAPLAPTTWQPSGLRLVVADDAPFVLDVDSSRVTRLPLPRGDGIVSITGVGGRAAVVIRGQDLFAVRASASLRSLGRGASVVASPDGASVWVKSTGRARCTLRQVALDGGARRAPRPFACATTLYPGGSLGVIVNRTRLIDPRTDRTVLSTRWGVLGAVGTQLVLRGPGRRLALLDATTRTERTLLWPSPLSGLGGYPAADPRGRYLALEFATPWDGTGQVLDIWVLDGRTGALAQLPGMPAYVSLKATSIAWTHDGRLVLLGESGARDVVAVWRPGDAELTLQTVRLPERSGGSDTFAPLE